MAKLFIGVIKIRTDNNQLIYLMSSNVILGFNEWE